MKRFGRHFVQRICAHLKDFRCAKDEAMCRLYMKKRELFKIGSGNDARDARKKLLSKNFDFADGKGNDARDARKSPDANMFHPGNPEAIPERLIY